MITVDTSHIDRYVENVRDVECRRRAYLGAAAIRRQFAGQTAGKAEETEHLAYAIAYEKRAAAVQ